jgi:CRISPR/Cas system endoribonuclease Cas6 (RAMP superfamily)
MEFNLVHLALNIRSDDVGRLARWLPLQGNTFGAVCRSLVCRWPERLCDCCSRHETCAWHLLFAQKLSSDPAGLKLHQKPPLPFMFTFPVSAGVPHEVECRLVVVGQAIPHLDLLLEGFAELLSSETCPFPAEIARIGSRDYQGTVHPFRDRFSGSFPENLAVLSIKELADGFYSGDCTVQIRLLSPLRLASDGRISGHFNFSRFARSLLRRVSSLAYYYGEGESDCDFRELSLQAEAIHCTEDHFSASAGRDRRLSGVIGSGTFSGDFRAIMPFLSAGTFVNAGKGASFGMGAYELRSVGNACQ